MPDESACQWAGMEHLHMWVNLDLASLRLCASGISVKGEAFVCQYCRRYQTAECGLHAGPASDGCQME